MLSFGRKNSTVLVNIEHGIFDDGTFFELTINQGQEYQAELLKRQFNKLLEQKLGDIKRTYYEQGYKDGRGKKTKRQYFFGNWRTNN